MTRAVFAVLSVLLTSMSGCSSGPPSPEEMKQMVVGDWAANSSAIGAAARGMKLGSQNPELSGSEAMAAGRALGAMAAEFREDGTMTATFMLSVFEGTWTFDAENAMVEMDLTLVEPPAPEDKPEVNKTAWVAILDPEKEKLTLYMFGRDAYQMFLSLDEKMQKNAIKFSLEKQD